MSSSDTLGLMFRNTEMAWNNGEPEETGVLLGGWLEIAQVLFLGAGSMLCIVSSLVLLSLSFPVCLTSTRYRGDLKKWGWTGSKVKRVAQNAAGTAETMLVQKRKWEEWSHLMLSLTCDFTDRASTVLAQA